MKSFMDTLMPIFCGWASVCVHFSACRYLCVCTYICAYVQLHECVVKCVFVCVEATRASHPNALPATAISEGNVSRLCHEALHNLMHPTGLFEWNKNFPQIRLVGRSSYSNSFQDAPGETGILHIRHACIHLFLLVPFDTLQVINCPKPR